MDLRSSLASWLYSDKFTSSWFSSSLDLKYYFEFFGLGLNGTLLVSSSVLSNDNDDFYVYRKLENHYYNPFIVKKIQEKVNFTHAIEIDGSEEKFMSGLIENHAKLDEKYNWCFTNNHFYYSFNWIGITISSY